MSIARGAALYVGALLGPSLLLLPGLAAQLAGPASVVAWVGLLGLSGLLAWVFTALGTRIHDGGVVAYVTAGLGEAAGTAVGWCFRAGVVFGAPVVCLIGGTYVGGGRTASVGFAVVLLVAVVVMTLGGARIGTTVQLVLVGLLMALVALAVIGSAPSMRTANWTPFAPHGWAAVGDAGAALMLSFVGWEAIAPLTGRLRDPRRQLPKVIGIAFAVTAVVYLALAGTTIAVLGNRAGSAVPLADLLRVAVGKAGPVVAGVAAVALTLAATNAYINGATAMSRRRPHVWIVLAGVVLLGGVASGVVTTAQLVAVPTTLFLTVYLGCTAAAVRVLSGRVRVAAGVACAVVLGVLVFCGWGLLVAFVIAATAVVGRKLRRSTAAGRAGVIPWRRDDALLR
ncbi:MAG TPA: APC family permease [Pseudonocardiaceae bacterium]|nr:APC family permease [Pseudonocardiaceae bacterium]